MMQNKDKRRRKCRNCNASIYGKDAYISHKNLCISMNAYRDKLAPSRTITCYLRPRLHKSLKGKRKHLTEGTPKREKSEDRRTPYKVTTEAGCLRCRLEAQEKAKVNNRGPSSSASAMPQPRRMARTASEILAAPPLVDASSSDRNILGNLTTNAKVVTRGRPPSTKGTVCRVGSLHQGEGRGTVRERLGKLNAAGRIKKSSKRRQRRRPVRYLCKPCGETLLSWQAIRKHLLSSEHLLSASRNRRKQMNKQTNRRIVHPSSSHLSPELSYSTPRDILMRGLNLLRSPRSKDDAPDKLDVGSASQSLRSIKSKRCLFEECRIASTSHDDVLSESAVSLASPSSSGSSSWISLPSSYSPSIRQLDSSFSGGEESFDASADLCSKSPVSVSCEADLISTCRTRKASKNPPHVSETGDATIANSCMPKACGDIPVADDITDCDVTCSQEFDVTHAEETGLSAGLLVPDLLEPHHGTVDVGMQCQMPNAKESTTPSLKPTKSDRTAQVTQDSSLQPKSTGVDDDTTSSKSDPPELESDLNKDSIADEEADVQSRKLSKTSAYDALITSTTANGNTIIPPLLLGMKPSSTIPETPVSRVRIDYNKKSRSKGNFFDPWTREELFGRMKLKFLERPLRNGGAKIATGRKAPYVSLGHKCDSIEFLRDFMDNQVLRRARDGTSLSTRSVYDLLMHRERNLQKFGKKVNGVSAGSRGSSMIRYDYRKTLVELGGTVDVVSHLLNDGRELNLRLEGKGDGVCSGEVPVAPRGCFLEGANRNDGRTVCRNPSCAERSAELLLSMVTKEGSCCCQCHSTIDRQTLVKQLGSEREGSRVCESP